MAMLFRKNGLLKKMTIHKNIKEIKEAHEITTQVEIKKAQAKLEAPKIIVNSTPTLPSLTALQSNPASQFQIPDFSTIKQNLSDSLNKNISSINTQINDKVKNAFGTFQNTLQKYSEQKPLPFSSIPPEPLPLQALKPSLDIE
jgi:hypothetical protein